MISLPDPGVLIQHIKTGLDAVADQNRIAKIANAAWFPEIAKEIATRISPYKLQCYARGTRRGEPAPACVGSEWLFDFCALITDPEVPEADRFMAQAAIVGEIEWDCNGIDHDFEKLMIVDALVCFMAFQQWSKQEAIAALDRLEAAARRRQDYARLRGTNPPPVFLLSCCVVPQQHRFVHRTIMP